MNISQIQPTYPPAPSRVLIVDDEQAILRAYSRILTANGYLVETASGGQAALALMDTTDVDVIMTDLCMPGMSGMEFLREVRKRDADLPVILMTASPSTESAVCAMEYGALRYLLKPLPRDALERALKDAVNLRKLAILKKQAAALFGDYNKQLDERTGLSKAFNRALTGVHMAYQPIVQWSTRHAYGFEGLVRSREPALPHPGALFDAAERLNEVEVLGRAIRKIVSTPLEQAPSDALLFVNLHTRDLMDENLFNPEAPLSKVASRVVLEITERASLHHVDDTHARVTQLRNMGFRIAIDDIGAGYAGLTSFALLEPDVVKVDMALVRDIHKTPTKAKLVASLVHLCKDLNILLVAEGVETVPERDALLAIGCDYFQGYLFGRPGAPFPSVAWG